jgi:protoporphyrinogen oxidase
MARDTAILGAGIIGLTMAHRLSVLGHRVTVYDRAPQIGGLSAATALHDFTWDRFYHVISSGDHALLALLEELGLSEEVRFGTARQGIYIDSAVRSLVGPMDLLRLPRLSMLDKFRLGMLALRGHRPRPDHELDGQTAAEWLTRRCGQRAFDRFWRPLLRSKLGDAANQASARFIHSTLQRLQRARGHGHTEQFGYVAGGYQRILDRMQQNLLQRGADIRLNHDVENVVVTAKDQVTVASNGKEHLHDRVIATLPNPVLAGVLSDLRPQDRDRLAATPYLGTICTVAIGRTPLSGHYILNLAEPDLAITGVIEMSALVDGAATRGHTLVYLPRYAVSTSPQFEQPDRELARTALQDLHRIFPATSDGWLLHSEVHRARLIQPIPLAGAPDHAPPREVVPGRVFCVTNAQLQPGALNNNDCVALAEAAARRLAASTTPESTDPATQPAR